MRTAPLKVFLVQNEYIIIIKDICLALALTGMA
jgi:hypothetical protein